MRNIKRVLCFAVFITVFLVLFGDLQMISAMESLTNPAAVLFGHYEFEDADDMFIFNGSAQVFGIDTDYSSLQLTLKNIIDDNYAGSVFTKNKIHLGQDLSFSTYFGFIISKPPAGQTQHDGVGEGFTFTLQAEGSNVFADPGPSIGTKDIEPSVSVAFDTFMQEEQQTYSDVTEDWQLVTVYVNGDYDSPEAAAIPAINIAVEDIGPDIGYQGERYVWIEYDGTTMEIYLSGDGARPADPLLTADLDLKSVFTTNEGEVIKDVYAGFTACNSPEEFPVTISRHII